METSLSESNNPDPSVGDSKGKMHETGGLAGPKINPDGTPGPMKIVPAVPGAASDPATGGASIQLFTHANPSDAGTFTPTISWHVHPAGKSYTYPDGGTVEHTFNQPPTGGDFTFAQANPNIKTNIVIGAGSKLVYFYNSSSNKPLAVVSSKKFFALK
jgi:hypothetical protein